LRKSRGTLNNGKTENGPMGWLRSGWVFKKTGVFLPLSSCQSILDRIFFSRNADDTHSNTALNKAFDKSTEELEELEYKSPDDIKRNVKKATIKIFNKANEFRDSTDNTKKHFYISKFFL
jgi:hypothetical protein